MNLPIFLLIVASLALPHPIAAQAPAAAPNAPQAPAEPNKLPVKRVSLYKNGVGYFEHVGSVRGNQNVSVTFTSGQLDDVLKSLTVLDLDGGRITGVTYGSSVPLDRQLADLKIAAGDKATLTEFLGALRGARVEVKSGATTITGRLLSVERKTRATGGNTLEVDYLSLLTDAGEMKTTELTSGFGVRLLDSGLNSSVGRYLDLVSMSREPDQRKVNIATTGSGERRLFVSYISEAPVWKATYRIVLPSQPGRGPLLQGWAIVDNVGAQDWENVELSLVAGAPQSFIQKLSQPYYSRRPVVAMKESMNLMPQTFEGPLRINGARLTGIVRDVTGAVIRSAQVRVFDAAGSIVGETTSDTNGRYLLESLPEGPMKVEVFSPGFKTNSQQATVIAGQVLNQAVQLEVGSMAESVTVSSGAPLINAESASRFRGNTVGSGRNLGIGTGLGRPANGPGSGGGIGSGSFRLEEARAALEPAAQAQGLGELFEYKLKEPITIRRSQSALVPILQSNVKAEKVSLWNANSGLAKPQRGIMLENSSGLTLDSGSFSVLDSDSFAGEGIFESIQPGEKRLVTYATDLAITPDTKSASTLTRPTHVRVSHGVMSVIKRQLESRTYTFRNEDSSPRTMLIEHPFRPGYQLTSPEKPVETSSTWMRFRLEVPAKKTASLTVGESLPLETTYQISKLNKDVVAFFVRDQAVNPALEETLRKVLAQQEAVAAVTAEKEARQEEITKIYDDQQRLRENIKALKGSAEERALLLRYTKLLNEQEDRIAQLKQQAAELEAKETAAQEALDKMIESISIELPLANPNA